MGVDLLQDRMFHGYDHGRRARKLLGAPEPQRAYEHVCADRHRNGTNRTPHPHLTPHLADCAQHKRRGLLVLMSDATTATKDVLPSSPPPLLPSCCCVTARPRLTRAVGLTGGAVACVGDCYHQGAGGDGHVHPGVPVGGHPGGRGAVEYAHAMHGGGTYNVVMSIGIPLLHIVLSLVLGAILGEVCTVRYSENTVRYSENTVSNTVQYSENTVRYSDLVGYRGAARSHHPRTIAHHPRTIAHHPRTISHHPRTSSHHPRTSFHRSRTITHHRPFRAHVACTCAAPRREVRAECARGVCEQSVRVGVRMSPAGAGAGVPAAAAVEVPGRAEREDQGGDHFGHRGALVLLCAGGGTLP
eukprot:1186865-Prorocentrum_minimum.AAC.1